MWNKFAKKIWKVVFELLELMHLQSGEPSTFMKVAVEEFKIFWKHEINKKQAYRCCIAQAIGSNPLSHLCVYVGLTPEGANMGTKVGPLLDSRPLVCFNATEFMFLLQGIWLQETFYLPVGSAPPQNGQKP